MLTNCLCAQMGKKERKQRKQPNKFFWWLFLRTICLESQFGSLSCIKYRRLLNPVESVGDSHSFCRLDKDIPARRHRAGLPQQRLFKRLGHPGTFWEASKLSSYLGAWGTYPQLWCIGRLERYIRREINEIAKSGFILSRHICLPYSQENGRICFTCQQIISDKCAKWYHSVDNSQRRTSY